jgi:hypothetical protein
MTVHYTWIIVVTYQLDRNVHYTWNIMVNIPAGQAEQSSAFSKPVVLLSVYDPSSQGMGS